MTTRRRTARDSSRIAAVRSDLQNAVALRQRGQLAEAEQLFRNILKLSPDHFDATHLLGIVLLQRHQFIEGEQLIARALKIKPNDPSALNNRGNALRSLKRIADALASYDKAIALKPDYAEAFNNRGMVLKELRRFDQALASYDKAIGLKPDYAEALYNQGNALLELKRFDEALASYDKAIALRPNYAEAFNNRGVAFGELKRFDEALASYDKAIALKPDYPDAFYNRGVAFGELKRFDEALASYDQAIALKPDYAEAFYNRGVAFGELKRFDQALASYDKAIALKPDYAEAFNNQGNALRSRGVALGELKRFDEALASFDRAIALRPDYANALNNRGVVLGELKRFDEAVTSYDKAIALKPDHAEALYNRGVALGELRRFGEALASYDKALAIKPDHKYAFSGLADCALKLCDWTRTTKLAVEIRAHVAREKSIIWPFVLLGYGSDAASQLKCAKRFIADKMDKISTPRWPLWNGTTWRHDKIRIAYLSADFHRHATAYLMAELFELHDRSRFEVLGISFGPDDKSDTRSRLIKSFDQFHDVRLTSDRDVAQLVNELQVDIAVDLKGYTKNYRPGILAHRPAPIQVNYLGYPGTMGADFIDYMIADEIVVPFDQQPYYTEKIVHLPECYQANDSQRKIAANQPTRQQAGLPASGFVFCCFNNNYKITAPVFDVWMRLLQAVDGSVLWLLRDNDSAETNLRKEAAARGVDPTRLVFATRLPMEDHLARHRLADLFLDTLPINAHTTASDALWAGLPVLTCCGESFAGRVAASLLHAIGLPELVVSHLEEYQALALKLAQDASLLATIKAKLARNRDTSPLFNSKRFTHHLEAAYTTMWEIWQRGETPRNFSVALNSDTEEVRKRFQEQALPHRAPSTSSVTSTVRSDLQNAVALRQRGRLAEAEQLCRNILKLSPDHFDATHLLGIVLLQRHQFIEGEQLIARALKIKPNDPSALNNRGNALRSLKRIADALASYDKAIALKPDYAEALYNQGNALLELKRFDEALASYDQAIALKPDYAEALYNQGNALLELKRFDEALASYDKAIALKPDYAEAFSNRGVALGEVKRFDEALASYDQAIALKPNYAEAFNNRGVAFGELKRFDEALASYDKAIVLKPDYAEAFNNLGVAFKEQGHRAEAVTHYERALALKPDYAKAKFALCMAQLPIIYMDETEIAERRVAYQECLEALCDDWRRMPRDWADLIGSSQPFFLAYQGYNDRALQSLYGSLVCRIMAQRYPPAPLGSPPRSDEPLRIGIVSGFFRQHSNWKIPIRGWLSQIDRRRFRVFGYYTGVEEDAETKRAVTLCDRFVQGPLSIDRWRQAIRGDAPHVLIYPEVGMDPVSAQLAAQRLASVQCNSWGHPETSGFPTLDYYLSSELMEPPEAEDHYTERLVRLPNLSIYYEPLDLKPASLSRRDLGLRSTTTIYWCGQSLYKYLPQFDQVFARIAREVSDCQFVFIKYPIGTHVTDLFRTRLDKAFTALGLRATDYCIFLPRLDARSFLAAIGQCDIVLDTIGWSGCNSTLESLHHDLPIVTMTGPLMRGRHSIAILKMMDVYETITDTIDDYISTAVRLAHDVSWRIAIKNKISENKHRVYYDTACVLALQEFLNDVARREIKNQSIPIEGKRFAKQSTPRRISSASRLASKAQSDLQNAVALHQRGQLAEAEQIYRRITEEAPDHFDATHLLGIVLLQRHQFIEGEQLIARALKIKPNDPSALNNRGNALRSLKRIADALASYDKAIALKPDYAEAFNNRGMVLKELTRFDQALASYDQAIALKSDYAEAFSNRGVALGELKRFDEAVASYDKAISLQSDYTEAFNNRGVALGELKRFDEALTSYDKAIALRPNYAEAFNNRGVAFGELKRFDEALASYDKAIALKPDYAEALNNRGMVLKELKRLDQALASYDKAIALKPAYAEVFNNRGVALGELKRFDQALASYDQAIALRPDYAEAFNNQGKALRSLKRIADALASYDKAIALRPDYAEAFYNRGVAFGELKRFDQALASYDKAIALKPVSAAAFNNRGVALGELKRFDEALTSFDRAIALRPDYANALNNRGVALGELKRFDEAVTSYDKAIALKPDYAEAFNNRGMVVTELKRFDEAVTSYDKAIALKPDYANAFNNRGNALQELRRFGEALASYDKALAIKPDHKYAFSGLADCALKLCDWTRTTKLAVEIRAHVAREKSIIWPFMLLGYGSDAASQLKCAKRFIADKMDKISTPRWPLWNGTTWRHDKIRIAYLSADFHRHATAYLMAELFELHDRSRFEVLGISFGPDDKSDTRSRLIKSFDLFHDVCLTSDRDAAQLVNELQVDIAVDLKGYTKNCRPGILAHRPAPIQVNYLGYPGTMGADFIDYMIADEIVVPFDQQPYYTEKIVHLPECYQANDSQRKIAANQPTRQQAGLPASGFVFCCFNNNYKITAPVFDVWMRLLQAVDGSVLWLLRDNDSAETNLRKEAAARGVDPTRLVFATRLSMEDHLARHRLADLFLDTLPYNAHTTASDALWAGLPVLTCCGESFAGRVAASLLHAIGLPELVVSHLEEYQALALKLAQDASLLATIKAKLARNRDTSPLFNSKRFTHHLEAAYTTMWEIWQRGETPRNFSVALNSDTEEVRKRFQEQALPHRASSTSSVTSTVRSDLQNAVALRQRGRLAEAEQLCRNILKLSPDHFDATHLLGIVLLQRHQFIEGEQLIARALKIKPNDPSALNNRGNALRSLKRIADALASYDKAIALKPDYAEAFNNRGMVLKELTRFDQALASYDQAIALRPNYAEALYNQGNALLELKRFDEALASYDKAIALTPDYAEAFNNRGGVLHELKRFDEALASYDQAIVLKPDYAEAFYNQGVVFGELKRFDQALASYDQAIALKPDYAEAFNNQGNALRSLKRIADALASYDKAIALKPDYAVALNNRGVALGELKRFDEALASYDNAIGLKPDYAEALYNQGNALLELKRFDEALASYDKAIALTPDYAEAFNNRGGVLHELKGFDEALASYDQAIVLKPDYAEAFYNQGVVFGELKRFDQALASYDQAIALKPDYAEAFNNQGNALRSLKRIADALASYDKAIALKPDYAVALNNRGVALLELKRLEEALANFDKAIALKPDYTDGYINRAFGRLLVGRYQEGWADYEWRLEAEDFSSKPPNINVSTWQGEDLSGRHLLVFSEQGSGDVIQFARYLPLLVERNCKITFFAPTKLARLLRPSIQPVEIVSALNDVEDIDFQVALMTLPHRFNTTAASIPNKVPYLTVEPELEARWRARIGTQGFKIGIAWQGNPKGKIDEGRSIPLEEFVSLSRIPGVRLISLQKRVGLDQLTRLSKDMEIEALDDAFDDGPDAFIDTAAVMSSLDLIITSDTAIAHLAGALGRPTWVALKYVPDWRWLLNREDSPWYPTLRLFRQSQPGDLTSVFANIERELRALLVRK